MTNIRDQYFNNYTYSTAAAIYWGYQFLKKGWPSSSPKTSRKSVNIIRNPIMYPFFLSVKLFCKDTIIGVPQRGTLWDCFI